MKIVTKLLRSVDHAVNDFVVTIFTEIFITLIGALSLAAIRETVFRDKIEEHQPICTKFERYIRGQKHTDPKFFASESIPSPQKIHFRQILERKKWVKIFAQNFPEF